MTTSELIANRLKKANKRYWAGDNISGYLHDGEKEALIEELTPKFEAVLGFMLRNINDDYKNHFR